VFDQFDDERLYHCQFYNEATKETINYYYHLSGGNPGGWFFFDERMNTFATQWDATVYTSEEKNSTEPQNEDLAEFIHFEYFKDGWGGDADT
jgi:hypothetical protein